MLIGIISSWINIYNKYNRYREGNKGSRGRGIVLVWKVREGFFESYLG